MFFESVARTTLRSIQFIKTTFIQWTQYVDPVLCQCCASVCDAGTTLTHHRANVSSLPDIQRAKTALHLSSITWLSILVITNHTRVETVWTGAIIVLYGVTAYYTRLSAHSVSGCTVVVIITVSVSCLNFYNHHSFSLQERFGDYLLRWLCEMSHETEDKESDVLVSRQNLHTLHNWQHVDKTPDEMESRRSCIYLLSLTFNIGTGSNNSSIIVLAQFTLTTRYTGRAGIRLLVGTSRERVKATQYDDINFRF